MTCKELTDFLMDYLEKELPERTRAEFERHIAMCPPCLNYLESYKIAVELGRRVCEGDAAVPDEVPEHLIQAILSAVRKG